MSRPCRYDRECRRADCYFSHPNGRLIDEQSWDPQSAYSSYSPYNSGGYGGGYGGEFNETEEMMQESVERLMDYEDEMARRDTWFPSSMGCNCCKGYVYACEDPTCIQLGVCGCHYSEQPTSDVWEEVDKANAAAAAATTTTTSVSS